MLVKTFIIAEAGVNHNGDLELAKRENESRKGDAQENQSHKKPLESVHVIPAH